MIAPRCFAPHLSLWRRAFNSFGGIFERGGTLFLTGQEEFILCYLDYKTMESKSHSGLKRKSGSPKTEKSKRLTASPKQETKTKKKEAENKQQKTRWEPLPPISSTQPETQVNASKEEEEKSHHHHLRIKDLLENKEKIIEYLFLAVTGTALQELIPDYLKKRSLDELKTLCTVEIQKMSQEEILKIISGKYQPSDENEKSTVSAAYDGSVEENKYPDKEDPKTKSLTERLSPVAPSSDTNESVSNDILELNPSSNEMKCITDDENQTPISIEEVAKDLFVSEKDSEIIELRMRARAIMSLLKAKGQNTPESDSGDFDENE